MMLRNDKNIKNMHTHKFFRKLVISMEFAKYMENFMDSFSACNYVC